MRAKILLLFIISGFISTTSFSQYLSTAEKQLLTSKLELLKNTAINYKDHSNFDSRSQDPILYDSIIVSSTEIEGGSFSEDFRFILEYEEGTNGERVDNITVFGEIATDPFPINKVIIDLSYDDMDREIMNVFSIEFLGTPIPAITTTTDYDSKSRIILEKANFNDLLGGGFSGDSIIYEEDGMGRVTSWSAYRLSSEMDVSLVFQHIDIQYNSEGHANGYTSQQVIDGNIVDVNRYSNLEFYNYNDNFITLYASSAASNAVGFDISFDAENVPTLLDSLVINGQKEIQLTPGEWEIDYIVTSEVKGDSLKVIYEYPGFINEIYDYIFDGEKLAEYMTSIDVLVGPVVPEDRVIFEYGENGNLSLVLEEYLDEGEWIEEDRTEWDYEYNSDNQLIVVYEDSFAEGEFDLGQRTELFPRQEPSVNIEEALLQDNLLSVAPNPAIDFIRLTGEGIDHQSVDQVQVWTIGGQLVQSQQLQNTGRVDFNLEVSINSLKAGIYFVTVICSDRQFTQPFIKI